MHVGAKHAAQGAYAGSGLHGRKGARCVPEREKHATQEGHVCHVSTVHEPSLPNVLGSIGEAVYISLQKPAPPKKKKRKKERINASQRSAHVNISLSSTGEETCMDSASVPKGRRTKGGGVGEQRWTHVAARTSKVDMYDCIKKLADAVLCTSCFASLIVVATMMMKCIS